MAKYRVTYPSGSTRIMNGAELTALAKRLFKSEQHGWGGTASEKITNVRKAGSFLSRDVNHGVESWGSKQKKWMYGV